MRFSPDGKLLAAGSYQIVTIWNAPTGHLARSLSAHAGPILSLAVAPDGTTAYSGGQDKTIRVWNLSDGKLLRTLIQPAPVTALAVVPGNATVASGGGDGVVRWLDGTDGHELSAGIGHAGRRAGARRAYLPRKAPSGSCRSLTTELDGSGRVPKTRIARQTPRVKIPGTRQRNWYLRVTRDRSAA